LEQFTNSLKYLSNALEYERSLVSSSQLHPSIPTVYSVQELAGWKQLDKYSRTGHKLKTMPYRSALVSGIAKKKQGEALYHNF